MKLSVEQIIKIQEHLKDYPLKCSVCKDGSYSVTDHVFKLDSFNTSPVYKIPPDGPVFPVIPMVCGKCGHVTFFNAVALGVFSAKDEADGKK